MIAHLNGRLVEKNPTSIVVECGGVGYAVKISLNTYAMLGSEESLKIYTQQIIREDAHLLFGFATVEERDIFNLLLSVSGIGPNTAILMLSSLSPGEVAQAIQTEDVRTIQAVKGIGAKTAQRIIIDLKDKVAKVEFNNSLNIFAGHNTNKIDALTALISLGIDKKAAEKAIEKVAVSDESVEQLIKAALKIL